MKKNEIEKIFGKLKMQIRTTGHNYGWLIFKGKKVLRVHYSHGKGDIPEKIINKIRGQLKLSQKDFRALIACPMTHEDYIKVLIVKGIIDLAAKR